MPRLILLLVFLFVTAFGSDVTHAQDTQTLRGYVSSVDDFNGTITLSSDPIPLSPTAELFESQCGSEARAVDREWLENELASYDVYLAVKVHYTRDGKPQAYQVYASPCDIRDQVIWGNLVEIKDLDDGSVGLVMSGNSQPVAFDAPIYRGPDFEEIWLEDIQPGEFVEMVKRWDEWGEAIIQVHVDPPEPELAWPSEELLIGADSNFQADNFSVRWTGQVEPKFSLEQEDWTFIVDVDDGVRLWVDGELIIDEWHGGVNEFSGVKSGLITPAKYDIVLEYFEGSGAETIRLFWESPSQPRQLIPADRLFAPSGGQGLLGEFYPNMELEGNRQGNAAFERVDPQINWKTNNSDDTWDRDGSVNVDPVSRIVRFRRNMVFTEGTLFYDTDGFPLEAKDLLSGDQIIIQATWRPNSDIAEAFEVQIFDPDVGFDWPEQTDPDVWVQQFTFERVDGSELVLFESWGPYLAIDALIVDEGTGDEVPFDALVGYRESYARASISQGGQRDDGSWAPQLVVELTFNASVQYEEQDQPTEFYDEWVGSGVVIRTEARANAVIMEGLKLEMMSQTEIRDEDGFYISLDELREGTEILVDPLASLDMTRVFVRSIQVDPFRNGHFDIQRPQFTTWVGAIRDDTIITEGGYYKLFQEAILTDGSTGEELELSDLQAGDLISFRAQYTDRGSYFSEVERNPTNIVGSTQHTNRHEGVVYAIDFETGSISFEGPRFRIVRQTRIRDEFGDDIEIADIPPGTQIIITGSPSAAGGPPVARSIEIPDWSKGYDWGQGMWQAYFNGVEGDELITTEQPTYLAVDAEILRGSGAPGNLSDIRLRESQVTLYIAYPPNTVYSPFGGVGTQLIIDPQEGGDTAMFRPVETGEVKGVVSMVESDRLTLEGPLVILESRSTIQSMEGDDMPAGDLQEGDILLIRFFSAPDGLRATRVRVVDPENVPQGRSDVIVSPFLGLVDGDTPNPKMLLAGPSFTVLDGADVRDAENEPIELEQIIPGIEVRVTAEPGPDGAVASRIKVAGVFSGGALFGGGGLSITSTFPEKDETLVPTSTVVEITFNEQVFSLFEDESFDYGLFPESLEFSDLDVTRDGKTILADVELEEDTVYQLYVASERFGLFTLTFTTGEEMPEGGVEGSIDLASEIPFDAIRPGESGVFLVGADDEEMEEESIVRGAPLERNGSYRFENVEPGEYLVFASVVVEFDVDEVLELVGFFDEDGDGEPDPIRVGSRRINQIDLTIVPPEPMEVLGSIPAKGDVSVDLETTIAIEFSDILRINPFGYPAVNAHLLPPPVVGSLSPKNLVLGDDGYTVHADVELERNTTYSLLVRGAETEDGLGIDEPSVTVFTTSSRLPTGTVGGRLALPKELGGRGFIQPPVQVALVPFRDFDPLDPDVENLAVAATLSQDGSYTFEHVTSARYVVVAKVGVYMPPNLNLPNRLASDFNVLEDQGRFGGSAPNNYVNRNFFGYSADAKGDPRSDVRTGSDDVDILLRPEDVRRVALRVVSVDPAPEELEEVSEVFDLTLEFSEPLVVRSNFIELEAAIRPEPLSGPIMDNVEVEDGGRVIVFRDIELDPSEASRFSVGSARSTSGHGLQETFKLVIGTAAEDVVQGDVQGTLELTGGEISTAMVSLYDPADDELKPLAGVLVESDGSFLITGVFGGAYSAYAEIKTVSGDDLFLLLDQDEDGQPDVFDVNADGSEAIGFRIEIEEEQEVPAGDVVQLSFEETWDLDDEVAVAEFSAIFQFELAKVLGIDLDRIVIVDLVEGSVIVHFIINEDSADEEALTSAVAVENLELLVAQAPESLASIGTVVEMTTVAAEDLSPVAVGFNAGATITLDLDINDGDQSLATLEVPAGETVQLAVYGSDLVNVTGLSVIVRFDTTQTAFTKATDAGGEEVNILRSQPGATALFLPARLSNDGVEFGGAILSPNENTAGTGEGLLGIFTFSMLEGYGGANFTVDQVLLVGLGAVQDTLFTSHSALVTPPLNLMSQEKGLVSFDFNSESGDQSLFHLGEVDGGEEINVEVYINDVTELINYSVTISYDPQQLQFVSFLESSFLFLGQNEGLAIWMPPLLTENTVEFGSAILGPSAAVMVDGSGHIGTLSFFPTEAFEETDLLVKEISTKQFGSDQVKVSSAIFARMTTRTIASSSSPTADFDGDGVVDFKDFFMFADAFGADVADLDYDLDGDGNVGLGDFFVFADAFGSSAKRIIGKDLLALEGRLELDAESTDVGVRLDLSTQALMLRGYAAVVEYDPEAFLLVEVTDAQSVLRGAEDPSLLLQEEAEGQVLLVGSSTGGQKAAAGLLARLHFQPVNPQAEGLFRIREALGRDADGKLGQLLELGQVNARFVPGAYALQPNFPNPFNPSTTLRYQLAEDGPVRLEVFDILGQKVRTLVADLQTAGFHRVVWDSRDDAQRQVAAGVYFSRLQAGEFTQVRKLLLLK
jgi:hypothetical protein